MSAASAVRTTLTILCALASVPISSHVAAQSLRVLFIGNSLTTVNNVPGLVSQLAAISDRRFQYRVVAYDGYSLEDHWNRGCVRHAIVISHWTNPLRGRV